MIIKKTCKTKQKNSFVVQIELPWKLTYEKWILKRARKENRQVRERGREGEGRGNPYLSRRMFPAVFVKSEHINMVPEEEEDTATAREGRQKTESITEENYCESIDGWVDGHGHNKQSFTNLHA